LKSQALKLNILDKIDICFGGSVGIALYPSKWNKVQVLNWIDLTQYDSIHYFGDKYLPDGNDYQLINHYQVIGHSVDSLEQTLKILKNLYE
jgi:phosphomannomutase